MPALRPRLHLSRAMLVVGFVALLIAALRIAISLHPHVRRCWNLAAYEDRLSQACRRHASRYRTCRLTVPCPAPEYCLNACLPHLARRPAAADADRARAAEAHRRAAADHEQAATQHAARARLYRRAAFRWWEPLPAVEHSTVFERYRCDSF